MRLSIVTIIGTLAAAAIAAPSQSNHVVHEKRSILKPGWSKRSRIPGHARLPMRIGLTQPNLNKGHDLLMEISQHDSPRFGQHYTAEEVIEIFAPPQEAIDTVREWLESSGISSERISQSANKQWIQFDADANEAEELLRTEYFFYLHSGSGNTNVGCDQYHVPAHVQPHIDYITPGLKLLVGGKTKEKREIAKMNFDKRGFRAGSTKGFAPPIFGKNITLPTDSTTQVVQLAQCDQVVTPACIAAFYNITKATKAAPGNELGIFEEGDFYAAEDLIEFFTLLAPNIPITTAPKLEGIDGGFAPSAFAGGESDLDFQISYPIIYPQNSILFQTDDLFYATGLEGGGGFLNTFLDAIDGSYCSTSGGNDAIDPVYPNPNPLGYQGKLQCGVYKPANVISISYGEQEDDLPTNYQTRQCAEMMKLGMQGVSIIIASGDSGVAARGADDGNADGCLGSGEVFNPDFPASCPYVTALGATYLPPGADAKKDQEVAVTRFPSGGGFSNIYSRPSYQNSAVSKYLASYVPPYKSYNLTAPTNNPTAAQTQGGLYNRGGRGYPDFSAVGDNVVIINNGAPVLIGGTSASAPVFAAILNRINEERIAAGKSTVGFVNPTLYAHPDVFNDITVGNNSGCNTQGFVASKGWDPVTGLGTPNYPAMLKLYMGLK